MTREKLIKSDEYIDAYINSLLNEAMFPTTRRKMKKFIKGLRDELIAENAALRQQVKDMAEVIKELRGKSILDSIDVRFDGITVHGEDRILSLTLSRKS